MEKNKNDNFKEIQTYMKGKRLHNTSKSDVKCCQTYKATSNLNTEEKEEKRPLYARTVIVDRWKLKITAYWEELRSGLELNKIEDMGVFFQKLLLERSRIRVGSNRTAQQTPVPV